jgi:hypothetical protein
MLDALVPIAEAPKIQLVSTTSVKVIFPNISSIKKPVLEQFRISWSNTPDLNSEMATTVTCAVSNTAFVVEDLPECQTFYFGICLIGENSGNFY